MENGPLDYSILLYARENAFSSCVEKEDCIQRVGISFFKEVQITYKI